MTVDYNYPGVSPTPPDLVLVDSSLRQPELKRTNISLYNLQR
jgi:hypothetical protein